MNNREFVDERCKFVKCRVRKYCYEHGVTCAAVEILKHGDYQNER